MTKAKPKPKEPTVTGPELADWLGLSVQAIINHARNGIVVRADHGHYLLKKSIQSYAAHIRAMATGRGSPTVEARGKLVAAQASLAESKAAAVRGELVAAADVEREWSGVLRTVRAGMLAVPSRCAQRLPGLTAHDVSEIDLEVRAALTEVGNDDVTQH